MYLQKAAEKCDIPIGGNTTLWQDRTLVEVNIAVLHSYNVRTKYHKKHHKDKIYKFLFADLIVLNLNVIFNMYLAQITLGLIICAHLRKPNASSSLFHKCVFLLRKAGSPSQIITQLQSPL